MKIHSGQGKPLKVQLLASFVNPVESTLPKSVMRESKENFKERFGKAITVLGSGLGGS